MQQALAQERVVMHTNPLFKRVLNFPLATLEFADAIVCGQAPTLDSVNDYDACHLQSMKLGQPVPLWIIDSMLRLFPHHEHVVVLPADCLTSFDSLHHGSNDSASIQANMPKRADTLGDRLTLELRHRLPNHFDSDNKRLNVQQGDRILCICGHASDSSTDKRYRLFVVDMQSRNQLMHVWDLVLGLCKRNQVAEAEKAMHALSILLPITWYRRTIFHTSEANPTELTHELVFGTSSLQSHHEETSMFCLRAVAHLALGLAFKWTGRLNADMQQLRAWVVTSVVEGHLGL